MTRVGRQLVVAKEQTNEIGAAIRNRDPELLESQFPKPFGPTDDERRVFAPRLPINQTVLEPR